MGAIRASQCEEHQAVARLQDETCGFVARESSADRDHIGMAAKQNADLLGHLCVANEKDTEFEQRQQNSAQNMMRMQQQSARQGSQFDQQRIQVQYDIYRMDFELDDL